jgi:hypothetical protein
VVTTHQRQLAAAIQLLCQRSGMTNAALCRYASIAPPTLPGYLAARRVPPLNVLSLLYKAAAEGAGEPLPLSWQELEALHTTARVRHCSCCTVGNPAGGTAAVVPEWQAEPIAGPGQTGRGNPGSGDRPVRGSVTTVGVEVLEGHLEAQRFADAHTLMHNVAAGAEPADLADFVAACRARGRGSEADEVLRFALGRPPEDLLGLAALFWRQGGSSRDLDILLGGTLPSSNR